MVEERPWNIPQPDNHRWNNWEVSECRYVCWRLCALAICHLTFPTPIHVRHLPAHQAFESTAWPKLADVLTCTPPLRNPGGSPPGSHLYSLGLLIHPPQWLYIASSCLISVFPYRNFPPHRHWALFPEHRKPLSSLSPLSEITFPLSSLLVLVLFSLQDLYPPTLQAPADFPIPNICIFPSFCRTCSYTFLWHLTTWFIYCLFSLHASVLCPECNCLFLERHDLLHTRTHGDGQWACNELLWWSEATKQTLELDGLSFEFLLSQLLARWSWQGFCKKLSVS